MLVLANRGRWMMRRMREERGEGRREKGEGIGAKLEKSKGDKPRVVIVGSGWSGFQVLEKLDQTKVDVRIVSPRNFFLFTPLLASTSVGTLSFRSIVEPVRSRTKPHK